MELGPTDDLVRRIRSLLRGGTWRNMRSRQHANSKADYIWDCDSEAEVQKVNDGLLRVVVED